MAGPQVQILAMALLTLSTSGGRVLPSSDTVLGAQDDNYTLNPRLSVQTVKMKVNNSEKFEGGVYVPVSIPVTREDNVRVFNSDEIVKGMMTPSDHPSFPRHTRFIVWMDQAGQYGQSWGIVKKGAFPDALVVVAQQGRPISEDGWQQVGTCNGGWSWFWTKEGKKEYKTLRSRKGACHNKVEWTDARRTNGKFHNLFSQDMKAWKERATSIGFTLMPWWDCLLYQTKKACDIVADKNIVCPPVEKKKRHQCAMWKRWNYAGLGFAKVSIGSYYAFPVVDPTGQPVEPYFSEFQKAMKTNTYFASEVKRNEPLRQFVGADEYPDWE